jgi:putative SOS response-associated peptidase YedK
MLTGVGDCLRAQIPLAFNAPSGDVYPGGPGIVVREQDGERILQGMTWGFPLPLKSKKTGQPIKPKPVNNIAELQSYQCQRPVDLRLGGDVEGQRRNGAPFIRG